MFTAKLVAFGNFRSSLLTFEPKNIQSAARKRVIQKTTNVPVIKPANPVAVPMKLILLWAKSAIISIWFDRGGDFTCHLNAVPAEPLYTICLMLLVHG